MMTPGPATKARVTSQATIGSRAFPDYSERLGRIVIEGERKRVATAGSAAAE